MSTPPPFNPLPCPDPSGGGGTPLPAAGPLVLCDDNGPFVRVYTSDATGTVSFSDFTTAGAAYTPVGTVAVCADETPPPAPAPDSFAAVTDVVPGTPWTYDAGDGLLSATVTVLEGTVAVVGVTGSPAVTLPAGASLSWSGVPEDGALVGPASVTANADSRAVVATTSLSAP